MSITEKLHGNSIIVTNSSNKINILKEFNKINRLIGLKFLTKEELLKKYYFSYDESAIYYLMDKYNVNIEIANIYLKNMYYVTDKSYSSSKLNNLAILKRELIDNDLLVVDDLFRSYLSNKSIVFYNYNSFTKLEKQLIKDLEMENEVEVVSKVQFYYKHRVFSFSTIFEEVEYVAKEIMKLLDDGVSIGDIKLTNVNSDYYDVITRIFSMYNLRVNFNDSKLISTKIAQEFLSMDDSISNIIEYLSSKYENNEVLNMIVKIVNKYIVFDNREIVREMIAYDFKNTSIPKKVYKNTIEVIDYLNDYIEDSNYVFMLSFNQNDIPKIYKDEDFITDNIKDGLLLDTTIERNKVEKFNTINAISNIKNLVITYKTSSLSGTFYPSNLILDMDMEVVNKKLDYGVSYSVLSDKINLCKYIDIYLKTGEVTDDLKLLYNNYSDIEYNTYDNKYKCIDKSQFESYLNKEFNLSYSSMDSYYKCPFRYYLSHVLRLNIYEEKFEAYVGSLFHYVLEKSLNEESSVSFLVEKFVRSNERVLTSKERFFINKLSSELEFIYDTIVNHLSDSNLKSMLFEERIVVEKYGNFKVTFKGFIDKIMYMEKDNETIVAIIDYKTGSADTNLAYLPYGLSMQLPVYLYLAKNNSKLKNITFAGFYLQKILSGPFKIDSKKTLEDQKRDSLLLYGYSNSDEDILYEFDKTYKESKYIKSMKVLKNGNFYNHAKILSNDEIDRLIEIVDEKIDGAIDKIVNCEFDISPKKTEKELLGCKFCEYSDICFKEVRDEQLIKEDKDLSFLRSDIDA